MSLKIILRFFFLQYSMNKYIVLYYYLVCQASRLVLFANCIYGTYGVRECDRQLLHYGQYDFFPTPSPEPVVCCIK